MEYYRESRRLLHQELFSAEFSKKDAAFNVAFLATLSFTLTFVFLRSVQRKAKAGIPPGIHGKNMTFNVIFLVISLLIFFSNLSVVYSGENSRRGFLIRYINDDRSYGTFRDIIYRGTIDCPETFHGTGRGLS